MCDGVSLNSTSVQGRVDVTNGAARILATHSVRDKIHPEWAHSHSRLRGRQGITRMSLPTSRLKSGTPATRGYTKLPPQRQGLAAPKADHDIDRATCACFEASGLGRAATLALHS